MHLDLNFFLLYLPSSFAKLLGSIKKMFHQIFGNVDLDFLKYVFLPYSPSTFLLGPQSQIHVKLLDIIEQVTWY